MNSDNDSQQEQFIEQIEVEDAASIDDFIRELEAKERDLQISSTDGGAFIEIEESDIVAEASAEADLSEKVVADLEEIFKSFNKQEKETAAARVTAEQLQQANREAAELRAQVRRLEKEREEMREAISRRQNDFENYRKRIERERAETRRALVGDLAMRMLPVVDNLGRALDSSDASVTGKSPEFQHFLDGISLVNRQLGAVLAEMGIEPIRAVGEAFDPHLHEAAATEESAELPPNTVTQELLRGYRIGEKVIRHAVVKVSSAATTAARKATDDEFDLTVWESE